MKLKFIHRIPGHLANPAKFIMLALLGMTLIIACGNKNGHTTSKVAAASLLNTGGDGQIFIRPSVPGSGVSPDFISFSTVSAYKKNPQTRAYFYESTEGLKLVEGLGAYALRFPGGTFAGKFKPFDDKYKRLIDAHIGLSKASGNMKTILVLNFKTGTTEEAVYVVNRFKDAGIDIVAIELGNEIHLKKYRDAIPNVEDYIRIANQYMDELRPLVPNAKFGISVANSRHAFDAEQKGNRGEFYEHWNTRLGEAVQSGELPVDAIIPHFYKQTYKVFDLPTREERFEGIMRELQIDSYAFLDKVIINYYKERFGKVEYWVTEWGVKEKQVYGNTLAEGIHISGFLMDLMLANQRTGGLFPHSCYQKLYARPGVGTISENGGLPTVEPSAVYKPETSWYAFHFMHDVLDGTNYVPSIFEGVTQAEVRMETFLKGNDFYIAFANRTGNAYTCNMAGTMYALTGDKPWATNGKNAWNSQSDYDEVILIDGQLTNVIPPWSYGYIKTNWDKVSR